MNNKVFLCPKDTLKKAYYGNAPSSDFKLGLTVGVKDTIYKVTGIVNYPSGYRDYTRTLVLLDKY